ncbi:MAG TPA: carotenoid biosynthesis protein [bacterium]|nr:carotenoid biosynthesis protein [bacterium]HNT64223.1 carotenoid biosynthesis protein [bacterium]
MLYFILLAGGLWHVLGWFQTVMTLIAGPLLIALNLWLLMEGWIALSAGERQTLVWWAGFVGIGGFFVEWLGSRTGLIFGVYRYSQVLQPQIAGVPVAIGFSWIGISLASLAVAQRLWKMFRDRQNFLLFTLGAAAMMVLFDRLLEPAAIRLQYWEWQDNIVPWQNFLAWGVLGFFFLLLRPRAIKQLERLPALWLHAYIAQAIYFVLVIFAKGTR